MMNGPKSSIVQDDIDEIISWDLPWKKMANTRILVTGASGMLPSYIVYTLLALNERFNLNIKVVGLVRNEEKAKRILEPILKRPDFQLIVHDLTLPLQLEGDVSYIFHGGSAAKPKEHSASPSLTMKSILIGTFNMLDLSIQKKCEAFVYFSSSEVYGALSNQTQPIQENQYGTIDILNPRSCYSEGKRAAETICASYQSEYGIRCVLPRFAHIYGPGLAMDDGRVQADFASKIIQDHNITLNSDGSAIRAYTYVADAISGLFFALLKGDDMAYNVANSNSIVSIRQLAETFISARPKKALSIECKIPEHQKNLYNPARFIGLDDSKLIALGWRAKVGLEDGVHRMLTYCEESVY